MLNESQDRIFCNMKKDKLSNTAESKLLKAEETTFIVNTVKEDLIEIIKLDFQNTGFEKEDYWHLAFNRFGNVDSGFKLVVETENNFC